MDFRTITIFIESGQDIGVDLHGKFALWELESILMRAMEKVHESEINLDTEEVTTTDEDGQESSD